LLFGIVKTVLKPEYVRGIWPAGIGVVFVVLVLFLIAGWNNTAYYPSTADQQSSLTLQNSSSSEFTLKAMFYVSFLVPFVLAYIVYAWRAIDKKAIDRKEIAEDDHAY
jgi:cytochrome d ubiquinol oxidase, subunit II